MSMDLFILSSFPCANVDGDTYSEHAELNNDPGQNGTLQAETDQWRTVEKERQGRRV